MEAVSKIDSRISLAAVYLLTEFTQELVGFFRVQGLSRRELDVQLLLQLSNHVESLPRHGEVEFVLLLALALALGVVLKLVATSQVFDHSRDHGFGDLHQIVNIGVCHIELANGEFRVVSHVDAFVSENSSDFVDSVKTTDDKLLQEQFRGDSHEEVELEVIVVCDEGLGGGTSSSHVHHRGLDLKNGTLA